jgi:hypothetical protein
MDNGKWKMENGINTILIVVIKFFYQIDFQKSSNFSLLKKQQHFFYL